MRRLILWTLLGATLTPASAWAQLKPAIVGVPVPDQDLRLGLDDVGSTRFIKLQWTPSFSGFESYEYEITYDRASTNEQPNQTRVVLDRTPASGEAYGAQRTGQLYEVNIHPDQVLEGKLGTETTYDNTDRNIVLKVFRSADPSNVNSYETYVWKFVFDTKPPPTPVLDGLLPGENHLKAYWTAPAVDTDVTTYDVGYCANVSMETCTATAGPKRLPCDPTIQSGASKTTSDLKIDGLTNGECTVVAVRAVDAFGNIGAWSNTYAAAPTEVTDFFELYRRQGGQEEGGFCFVATAAYGSYAHPAVRVLRLFRDRVLKASPAGTALVLSYYRLSPPLAELIRQVPALRSVTRAILVPVALLGLLMVLLPFLGALVVLWRLLARLGTRGRTGAAAAALLLALLLPAGARAEVKPARLHSDYKTIGLGFEFKGGPYLPGLATTNAGGVDAFARIFDPSPNPLYSLGMELQLYRGFGTLGVGGNFGFMQFVGKSFFGTTDTRSNDTTVLNILPLKLLAVYRFDWLADHTPIPLVPYARGGLAYYVWWATNGTGDISRVTTDGQDDVIARGGKFGVAGSVGVAFLLNFLEPQAARSLQSSTGIRGTYFFAELEGAKVDGFGGNGLDLSDFTWNLGMFLEL